MADYDPQGALGGLFAPAHIYGNAQSDAAVKSYMDTMFSMTNPKVEQTRQPVPFNTGNPAGVVDTEALRVLAQGGPYDMNARRNAIALAIQNQPKPQPQQPQQIQQPQPYGGFMAPGGPYSGGGPVAAGLAPPQVGLGVS